MTDNPIATHIPRKQGAAYRDLNVFYNEWDKPTAAWLVELGNRNCLHSGTVDTRSIRDVRPDDLRGYDQCHFFAGIGGWPYALELAGYGDLPCWTGSPPCQPFSVAGKRKGRADERHLAPTWLNLIRECRPPVIIGEQVADAIRTPKDQRLMGLSPATIIAACLYACDVGCVAPTAFLQRYSFVGGSLRAGCLDDFQEFVVACAVYAPECSLAECVELALASVRKTGWLDDLFDALEECGYACGASVLPACSVGAPHIRKRLFFGAVRLADAEHAVRWPIGEHREDGCYRSDSRWEEAYCIPGTRGEVHGLADSTGNGRRQVSTNSSRGNAGSHASERAARPALRGGNSGLADTDSSGRGERRGTIAVRSEQSPAEYDRQNPASSAHHGGWAGADWLGCRDGKFRPVEPGTQPLAHGLPARVGRLRGYGNAIVPQVAAEFVAEFMASVLLSQRIETQIHSRSGNEVYA